MHLDCAKFDLGLPLGMKYTAKRNAALKHLKTCYGKRMTMRDNLKQCSVKRITRQALGTIVTPKDVARTAKIHVWNHASPFSHQWAEVRTPRSYGHNIIITCKKCARLANGKRIHKSCEGMQRRHSRLMAKNSMWKKLRCEFSQWVPSLCDAWNLTQHEAIALEQTARKKHKKGWSKVTPIQQTAWCRNLCQDGDVEPNPGPSLQAAFLNTNGVSNLWSAMPTLVDNDIFAICETKCDAWNHKSVISHVQKSGFRTWGFPGICRYDANGRKHVAGGMVVAVRSSIHAYSIFQHQDCEGDLITLDMHDFCITFLWQRGALDNEGGLSELLAEQVQQASAEYKSCYLCRDWNMTPEENPLAQLGLHTHAVCDSEGSFVPSRWPSQNMSRANRCIDYIVSDSYSDMQVQYMQQVCSDHKIITFYIQASKPPEFITYMRLTASYAKPSSVSTKMWRKALEQVWNQMAPMHIVNDPNEDWATFCSTAELAHQLVCDEFSVPYKQQFVRPKGTLPAFEQNCSRKHSGRVNFKIKSIQKAMARCISCQQLEACGKDFSRPATKLRTNRPLQQPMPESFAEMREALHRSLEEFKKQSRAQGLQKWKQTMEACGKAASACLKCDTLTRPSSVLVPDEQGNTHATATAKATLEAIGDFWQKVWQRDAM